VMGMHIGAQIHATLPIEVSNALQRIYHEIDSSQLKFLLKQRTGAFLLLCKTNIDETRTLV